MSIAVLPPLNETVDMDAPVAFRPHISREVMGRGYTSPPAPFIDEKLAEKDILEAGQVFILTPQEMGALLGTDAVLYTTVIDWKKTYVAVYQNQVVAARFELFETATGDKMWDSEWKAAESRINLSVEDAIDGAIDATLQSYEPFIIEVVDRSFASLPYGPHYVPPKKRGCL